MRIALHLCSLALLALVYAESELPLAAPCDEEKCKLPDCRCSSNNIPGNLDPRDTPQFVLLTFDDGVNALNTATYRSLLYNRVNKNKCPAGATFFVSHEYTDYSMVNELYNQGYEIALHSISHKTNDVYWRESTYETLMREFGDQKTQIAHFANIPANQIFGIRSPFLQLSGNSSFQVIKSAGLRYDLSWPTLREGGLWPYTLDYASTQDCIIPPCPTASIPGTWVLPINSWEDLQGFRCSFVDACFHNPLTDEEGWFQFYIKNFERHYLGNRTPFGFYVHEAFFTREPAAYRALVRFLDMLNNLNDVFMVNANEVINWVQNPIPVNEYAKKDCPTRAPSNCRSATCGPLYGEHNGLEYRLTICNRCPRNYPWVGNPIGN